MINFLTSFEFVIESCEFEFLSYFMGHEYLVSTYIKEFFVNVIFESFIL